MVLMLTKVQRNVKLWDLESKWPCYDVRLTFSDWRRNVSYGYVGERDNAFAIADHGPIDCQRDHEWLDVKT